MSENTIKVLSAGSAILDILVNVDEVFITRIDGDKGGMELVDSAAIDAMISQAGSETVKAAGGSAANTINGLAKLGMATSLLGKIGKDADGDFYKSSYEKNGGDSSNFRFADVYTGRCLSLVTPDSERTMRTDLGAAMTMSPADWDVTAFKGCTHVHIEGYMLFNKPLTDHVVAMAKEAGCTISLDLASFEVVNVVKDMLPTLLTEYVDIVFANEDEAKAFTGHTDPVKALGALAEFCKTAVVKVGKDGAFLHDDGLTVKVWANAVEAIDTTGAGDLWQAGFLFGFLQNKTLATCGEYGSVLGAEVVQVMGAAIPEDRWDVIVDDFKKIDAEQDLLGKINYKTLTTN